MTTHKDTAGIIERLEAACGPDRELDLALACIKFGEPEEHFLLDELKRREFSVAQRYTSSIDAALTLVPEGWKTVLVINEVVANLRSDRARCLTHDYSVDEYYAGGEHRSQVVCGRAVDGEGKTPAIALCIAALRARAHKAEG